MRNNHGWMPRSAARPLCQRGLVQSTCFAVDLTVRPECRFFNFSPPSRWQKPHHHHRPALPALIRTRQHQPCLLHVSSMDTSTSPYGTRRSKARMAVAILSWPRLLDPTRMELSTSVRPAYFPRTSSSHLTHSRKRTSSSETAWSLLRNRTSLWWCTVEWKWLPVDRPPSRLLIGNQSTRRVVPLWHRWRFRRLHHDPYTGSHSISGLHSPADRSLPSTETRRMLR